MLNLFWGPPKKSAPNPGNVKYVKYVKCLGGKPPPLKGPTFNIFNISPVLSIKKKHLTFPLFREGRVTKQGNVKCFFRKTPKIGDMLNMLNVCPFLGGGDFSQTFNIFNIFNISRVWSTFFGRVPKQI